MVQPAGRLAGTFLLTLSCAGTVVQLVLRVTAKQHGRAVLAIGYETVILFCCINRDRSNNGNL